MFDSLSAGYIPVCLIVVIISWFIARAENVAIRAFLALTVPILASFGWFFIPRVPKLFQPLRFGEDPWIGWGIIAAATWSIVAVPVCFVSVFIFVFYTRHKNKKSG